MVFSWGLHSSSLGKRTQIVYQESQGGGASTWSRLSETRNSGLGETGSREAGRLLPSPCLSAISRYLSPSTAAGMERLGGVWQSFSGRLSPTSSVAAPASVRIRPPLSRGEDPAAPPGGERMTKGPIKNVAASVRQRLLNVATAILQASLCVARVSAFPAQAEKRSHGSRRVCSDRLVLPVAEKLSHPQRSQRIDSSEVSF